MLSMINRCAILIRYKEPFLKWAEALNGARPEDPNGNVYLAEETENGTREEVRLLLRKYWREIADEEFYGWWTEEKDWPELKTVRDFEKYFHWEYRELVGDLSDTTILHDDELAAPEHPDHSLN